MRAHENPYRTCRVESLPFRATRTVTAIVTELSSLDHRAAIVGPEGAGKSTLLREIADALVRSGMRSELIRFDDHAALFAAPFDREAIWLVDGAERIPLPLRALLVNSVRRIVITSHRWTAGLPVLFRCATTVGLFRQLTTALGETLPEAEAETRFRDARGNLRLALRSLYDDAAAQDFVGAFRAR